MSSSDEQNSSVISSRNELGLTSGSKLLSCSMTSQSGLDRKETGDDERFGPWSGKFLNRFLDGLEEAPGERLKALGGVSPIILSIFSADSFLAVFFVFPCP